MKCLASVAFSNGGKKPEPLCLKIRWHLMMLGGRQGWGRVSFAGDTVPLLLFLAKDTLQLKLELKSQSSSLTGSQDSLTRSIFFPRGICSPTMSPGLSLAFGHGRGRCHQKQAEGVGQRTGEASQRCVSRVFLA